VHEYKWGAVTCDLNVTSNRHFGNYIELVVGFEPISLKDHSNALAVATGVTPEFGLGETRDHSGIKFVALHTADKSDFTAIQSLLWNQMQADIDACVYACRQLGPYNDQPTQTR
jgi:hypothetical protein